MLIIFGWFGCIVSEGLRKFRSDNRLPYQEGDTHILFSPTKSVFRNEKLDLSIFFDGGDMV